MTDVFTAVSTANSAVTRLVTITVTGADDPAEISGMTTGAVTENDATTASGTLTISDPDSATTFTSLDEESGTYGAFRLAASGAWTYTLDNEDVDTNALAWTARHRRVHRGDEPTPPRHS